MRRAIQSWAGEVHLADQVRGFVAGLRPSRKARSPSPVDRKPLLSHLFTNPAADLGRSLERTRDIGSDCGQCGWRLPEFLHCDVELSAIFTYSPQKRHADLLLREREGRRRQGREALGRCNRLLNERVGGHECIDQPTLQRAHWVKRRPAIQYCGEVLRCGNTPHNLQRNRGKRHTHQQFGYADASTLRRHEATICGTGEDAPTSNSMAINGGNHWFGKTEERLKDST